MILFRPYDIGIKIAQTGPALPGVPTRVPEGVEQSQIHQIPTLAPQVSWDFQTNPMVSTLSDLILNPSYMSHSLLLAPC